MSKLNIPLVILAGGQSKRMQKDKALLPFAKHKTILQYHLDKHQNTFSNIFVSTNKNSQTTFIKHKPSINFIFDKYNTSSPMVALASIMEFLKEDFIVMSVDTPFIDNLVFDTIYEAYKTHKNSPIICTHNNNTHPLVGLYNSKSIDIVEEFIKNSNHKIKNLLDILEPIYLSTQGDFFNMNTVDDYNKCVSKIQLL